MTLDPITDYVLFVKAARLTSCPRCKAGPHAPCVSNTGRPRIEGFHAARRAAAEALPREQAEAMVAADEDRQRQAREQMRPITPEQLATRKATGDALRAIAREAMAEDRARCAQPFSHPPECACRQGRPVAWVKTNGDQP